jgi:UDP-N-acetylglucosamine 3-dehydrogenase
MLGVAVIGLGDIGQIYTQAVQECPSARLVVVCDVDEARREWARSQLAVPTTSRFEETLARDDVDVVAVCLPHDLHHLVGCAALAAGKHVLLEKPMATTVDECDRLIAAAAEKKLVVGVSHNRLFVPANIRAHELIESGAIGEPVLLRQRLGVHEPYAGWRADPKKNGGGLLSDSGAHQFYLAQYLFGKIVGVRSWLDVPDVEGEAFAMIWMEFESGSRGVFEASYWGPTGMFDDSLEIVGSEGVLKLGGLEAATFGYRRETPLERYRDRVWTADEVEFMDWQRTVITSVQAFVSALDEGRPVPTSGEDGRDTVRLIHAAYESATILGKFTRPSLAGRHASD